MLRLDNVPQAKVHADCFIASLCVCLAPHTERCIVIVVYHNETYHNAKFDIPNVYSFTENRNVKFTFHGRPEGRTLIITYYTDFFLCESKKFDKMDK